ncbi:MAG: hypothetical protein ACK4RZ_12720 [Paracoccaceae bacterium]
MTAQKATPTVSSDDMRLLDQDEAQLVEAITRGDLAQMSQSDLSDLIQRLRDRRDRARDLANRQRREVRGKADPSGATPATHNAGNEGKARVLGDALEMAMHERTRRDDPASDVATPTQRDLTDRAMALKEAGTDPNAMLEYGGALHPSDPDADPGKGALAAQARNIAPSGALDHAGELPSRERSRTRY